MNGALVPAPARQPKPAPITTAAVSNGEDTPYWGVMFKPERRWIRALDLNDVVADFCASRDDGGYGASDLGGRIPLLRMNASGKYQQRVGWLCYNGNVVIE